LNNQGFPAAKLRVIPLWVNSAYWQPASAHRPAETEPLRVLFVGKINLRKGVPYLIQAAASCGDSVTVTLIGDVDDELTSFLKGCEGRVNIVPPCTKSDLRKHYSMHDLLVLPSLGDSFGFVAMEAMACGLPVVVSENCGAPVPDSTWRVPAMDSKAIAQRLEYYAGNRLALRRDGQTAHQFARKFTPERYREEIKELYRQLLEKSA